MKCPSYLHWFFYGSEDGLSKPRTIIHSVCGVHLGFRKGELQKDKTVT